MKLDSIESTNGELNNAHWDLDRIVTELRAARVRVAAGLHG